jgi:hypothetical protein
MVGLDSVVGISGAISLSGPGVSVIDGRIAITFRGRRRAD